VATQPKTGPELVTDRPRRAASPKRFAALMIVLVLVLAGAIAYGLLQRSTHDKALAISASEAAGRAPSVNVAHVRKAPATSTLELPGDTLALAETPIYARADGYMKERSVDIGDRVKKGQLLAEIETPELDQQIAQARATLQQSRAALQQSKANLFAAQGMLKLASVTRDRWKRLVEQGVVSKQDFDEKDAAQEAAQAGVQAAEENVKAGDNTVSANDANLHRLEELKTFDKLLAPFDGVITWRNVQAETGSLVSSGNTGANREIVRVAQLEVLRVFVNVPQTYATVVRPEQIAEVTLDEFPGRKFAGKVARTTNAVDATSRTLLAVVLVQNPKGELLPGMYAKVRFSLPHAMSALLLPADALVLQSDGPQVAVVDAGHKIHFRKVTLGRDFGAEVEVPTGLEAGETVVLNPNDAIREGVVVDPKERAK
jgi:RND family efflux transporter MFP subunit